MNLMDGQEELDNWVEIPSLPPTLLPSPAKAVIREFVVY